MTPPELDSVTTSHNPPIGEADVCLPEEDFVFLPEEALVCEVEAPVCEAGDAYFAPNSDAGNPGLKVAAASLPLLTMAAGIPVGLRRALQIPSGDDAPRSFILGRGHDENHIRLVEGWDPRDVAKISRNHAELRLNSWGDYQIRDAGSINGTTIYREDALRGYSEQIHVNSDWVTLQSGDVIRFGSVHYEWLQDGGRARLMPTTPYEHRSRAIESAESSTPIVQERPLVERLREAERNRHVVEVFIEDSKEKYVGRIEVIGSGSEPLIRLHGEGFRSDFTLDQILTLRYRHIDLTDRYVHPRINRPQFRDRSINVSGTQGDRMVVLVDFEDPRLTRFLDAHMSSIRDRLDRGEISQREAAIEAWRIVSDYVPYDRGRLYSGIPNQMYRLGDFIEHGVCNERGMLLQVSLQYVGVESEMEKGPFMGGRHAWARAWVTDRSGRREALILDPQRSRIFVVGVDHEAGVYNDDATPFARRGAMTILVDSFDADFTSEAEQRLREEGIEPQRVLEGLRALRSEQLRIDDGPMTWEHIENLRRGQVHGRLWISSANGGDILYNRPYERLGDMERLAEQEAALEVYRGLSPELRAEFWQAEGEIPDGQLPNTFLERYFEQRVALHEEGLRPFGQAEGLAEAIVAGGLPAGAPGPASLVTPAHIALEIRDRYLELRAPEYNAVVDALAEEIFTEWEREHRSFTSERLAIDNLPPEEFLERGMERLFERMEAKRRITARDAIRASDQGRREDRDTSELRRVLEPSAPLGSEVPVPVSQDNIALELRDRYPTLQEPVYNSVIDVLAEEIFREWERDRDSFTSQRPAIDGLPSEEFLERSMERLFERMEARRRFTARDAIRGSDRGRREDRDTSRLEETLRRARDIAERR